MSSKQMARTVLDGRMVTFTWPQSGAMVTGYLCGMDDFHWMVIEPSTTKHLVHKGQSPLISFAAKKSYDGELNKAALEQVIGPFREALAEQGLIPPRSVPATPEGLSA